MRRERVCGYKFELGNSLFLIWFIEPIEVLVGVFGGDNGVHLVSQPEPFFDFFQGNKIRELGGPFHFPDFNHVDLV